MDYEELIHETWQIFMLFRKFSIFPATQNKDERLFSMVGRTTGALSCFIYVKTIEKNLLSKVRYRNMVLCFITKMESIVTEMMEMTAPKSCLWLFNKQ